jgi:hypothetical protein
VRYYVKTDCSYVAVHEVVDEDCIKFCCQCYGHVDFLVWGACAIFVLFAESYLDVYEKLLWASVT